MTQEERENWFREMWQPVQWANTAANLLEAANVLFSLQEAKMPDGEEPLNPEYDKMDMPATLLFGFAMENAIKGALVKKLELDESNCKKVAGWQKHNLLLLCKAGIPVNDEEARLLDTLTPHLSWAGKYPVTYERGGQNGFFLAKQYEHGHYKIATHMPPRTFDEIMRYKLNPLFKRLLDECKDDGVQIIKR